MGMNIMKLMQKVQSMQKKAGEMQEELAMLEITGESGSGSIKATVDGRGKFKSIKIDPELIKTETADMIEDLITAAIKDAQEKSSREMETRMSALTGGIKIPGLSL